MKARIGLPFLCWILFFISACSSFPFDSSENTYSLSLPEKPYHDESTHYSKYAARLPVHIQTNEPTILVDPKVHAWGAYDANGDLMRAGLASAGANWCEDIESPCQTQAGVFRVYSIGDADCYSTRFPIPTGGAPMPYCMYFNHNQALHGSPSSSVVEGNVSHGCVRMHIKEAKWLRENFVTMGTKVIILPY